VTAVQQYVPICPRCRQNPSAHAKPAGLCEPCHGDVIRRAVASIRLAVLIAERPPELDCCVACGCLVLPDEQCPGCRAQREKRAQRAA
jgi:hypothetical protein